MFFHFPAVLCLDLHKASGGRVALRSEEVFSPSTSGRTSCLSSIPPEETIGTFLLYQITNTVVTNQSANATIALGASPIMATAPEEMEDLSKVAGSLLVNFGTIQNLDGMLTAGDLIIAIECYDAAHRS